MVKTVNSIISHSNSKTFGLKHLTWQNIIIDLYVAECKFCKMQYVGHKKYFSAR